MTLHLMIGGDVSPTKNNYELFSNGDVTALMGDDLLKSWLMADLRFFNLEVPLVNDPAPIAKLGPCLSAPKSVINGIAAMRPTLVGLANNHIMDHGAAALALTCSTLDGADIAHTGAGTDLNEAVQPWIFEKDGISIGFYACTEHEFSIAGNEIPGAAPFDPLETPDQIAALRKRCDWVIVLYHGGKEYYRYPSPGLQRSCRKLIDRGADLVLCQHSHCIGCFEQRGRGGILYGQGNFIFSKHEGKAEWDNGLLMALTLDGDSMKIEPLCLTREGSGVRLSTADETAEIMCGYNERSEQIRDDAFVERHYAEFARESALSYLAFFGGNRFYWFCFRKLYKLFGNSFVRGVLKKPYLLAMQDYLENESHRELFLAGIKKLQ